MDKLGDYHRLPKEQQWLPSRETPFEIGGRTTDISQIASYLEVLVKEHYAMNAIPKEIVRNLWLLKCLLEIGEKHIQELIMLVATSPEEDQGGTPCPKCPPLP